MMNKIVIIIVIIFLFINCALSQCKPDRHSINAHDGWVSHSPSNNPNPNLGTTHWVLYNFGEVLNLYQTTFWNLNHPDHLDWGVKKMRFDYSLDSLNWTYFGTFNFIKAPGSSIYEGEQGPDLNGISAKYILLTPEENFDSGSYYGFSKIKFETDPAPSTILSFNINPCINDGIIYNISGGIDLNGTYTGTGVINSYNDHFDFDPQKAGTGTHIISYQYVDTDEILKTKMAIIEVKNCGTVACPPCPACDEDSPDIFNSANINSGIYFADPSISSNGTVDIAHQVDYNASQQISLNNNFQVKQGAGFEAKINNCDSDFNLFENAGLENGLSPWAMELNAAGYAELFLDSNTPYEGNYCARVEIINPTQNMSNIQFKQFGMSLNNGQTYLVSFAAKTNQPKQIYVSVGRHNFPYSTYGYEYFNLTQQWQIFTFEITPNETNINQSRLSLMLSYPTGQAIYWFDNLKIAPK